jgi:ribosomal protein S18 acetylase RimI-like enzyme
MDEVKARLADARDVDAIAQCVQRAYAKYAERLPLPPKPVLADYAQVVASSTVWVLVHPQDGLLLGVLVLVAMPDHLLLDNIAVEPAWQGRGLGRRLLALAEAEACRLGLTEVQLYTHALMTENRALYARVGYLEYARKQVNGRDAVFMRKSL